VGASDELLAYLAILWGAGSRLNGAGLEIRAIVATVTNAHAVRFLPEFPEFST